MGPKISGLGNLSFVIQRGFEIYPLIIVLR